MFLKSILTHPYKIFYYNYNKTESTDNDIVVTFHGIYGEHTDLDFIAKKLSKSYSVINIQYPTTQYKIEKMAKVYIDPVIKNIDEKLTRINEIRENNNQTKLKLHFVVHSMGTIILRYYLEKFDVHNLGKVVFVSPPSHGTTLSDYAFTDFLEPLLGPAVAQMKTDKDSFVNKLREPWYPAYILIGNKSNNPLYSLLINGNNDGMVPVGTAKLKNCKFKIIDNTTHTSILKNNTTLYEIKNFFNE